MIAYLLDMLAHSFIPSSLLSSGGVVRVKGRRAG